MTDPEIEAILQAAAHQCNAAACPLSEGQQQILRQTLQAFRPFSPMPPDVGNPLEDVQPETPNPTELRAENPLDQLTPEERRTLLEFVSQQEEQQQPWKITLLNDWLQGRGSGAVQFIRERYGIQWLDQVQSIHLARYEDQEQRPLKLKVGDRIEVTNGLWEWVQETGPCSREWFPCTVVSIAEPEAPSDAVVEPYSERSYRGARCVIRFESGAEYEIQGIYDWNRPNWRWLPS